MTQYYWRRSNVGITWIYYTIDGTDFYVLSPRLSRWRESSISLKEVTTKDDSVEDIAGPYTFDQICHKLIDCGDKDYLRLLLSVEI